jgi:hypothetical protein
MEDDEKRMVCNNGVSFISCTEIVLFFSFFFICVCLTRLYFDPRMAGYGEVTNMKAVRHRQTKGRQGCLHLHLDVTSGFVVFYWLLSFSFIFSFRQLHLALHFLFIYSSSNFKNVIDLYRCIGNRTLRTVLCGILLEYKRWFSFANYGDLVWVGIDVAAKRLRLPTSLTSTWDDSDSRSLHPSDPKSKGKMI